MNHELTKELAQYNKYRLEPGNELGIHPQEITYIEKLRESIEKIPPGVSFEWYESLLYFGPGQNDPLFPWLAEYATLDQMKWFLTQEVAGEAGFDDLVAMTQVKMLTQVKLEMANNYWDEMGNGREEAMHGKLLERAVQHFGIVPSIETTVSEALQLTNLMTGLAANRRYAYQSLGALGAIEMTAPGRVSLVDKGLLRLGVPSKIRTYFTVHATLDIKHSEAWNREVIKPLSGTRMREIAEGAYLRLWCGKKCFERYRQEFNI